MPNSRSWQDSFDKLELARREDGGLHASEAFEIRAVDKSKLRADTADVKACTAATPKLAAPGFMLIGDRAFCDEVAVKVGQADTPKRRAKSASPKVPPCTRAAPQRAAKAAKSKAASDKVPKPRKRRPRASPSDSKPANVALTPLIVSLIAPREAYAEMSANSPLPRHASLAPYRKPGLFGLIGSWLRLATRLPLLPKSLRKPAESLSQTSDDLGALKAENEELRRQLESLLARQEAESPPWVTTPAGKAPARPRRRGGTRP
jgi:hypothetical protein